MSLINRILFLFSSIFLIHSMSAMTFNIKDPEFSVTGSPCRIDWEIDFEKGDLNFTHANFVLVEFSYDQFNLVEVIALNVNILEMKSLIWEISRDSLPGRQYAVAAYAIGVDYLSISNYFWITDYYI